MEHYEVSRIKLWSPLVRALATCGQSKGSPQQWIGTIRNLRNKGVSGVEIDWSQVIPFLEQHDAPLLHLDALTTFLTDRPPCELVLQRLVTDEYLPQVRYEQLPRPARLPPIVVRQGRREIQMLHYRDRTFGLCIWLHVEFDSGLFGRHRYWSFSVPRGGKKLASHPVSRRFASSREAMAYGRALVERMARRLATEGFIGQRKAANQYTRYVLPGGENYSEWLITAPHLCKEYWGEHFEVPNIIAHVRTTDRATPQGARLLVLEEIQSDWNQELRRALQEARRLTDDEGNEIIEWEDGIDPPPLNPYLNHWLDAALRMMLLVAVTRGIKVIAWLPGALHAERFPWANADGLETFYDRIVPAAVHKLVGAWGVGLEHAQLRTLSRYFIVRQRERESTWRVWNLQSGQTVDGEFADYDSAEAHRRSMETNVLENVPAVFLSDEMLADILANGLPYLGSVGKRLTAYQRLKAS
jgi:hypothetical protein